MLSKRPSRLQGYDYSSDGYYFVTLLVKNGIEMLWTQESVWAISNRPNDDRKSFSEIFPILSRYGLITEKYINEVSIHYKGIKVEDYVIMPNHVHMLVKTGDVDSQGRLIIAQTNLPTLVQQLKQAITKHLHFSLWTKGYVDHIVRDEEDKNYLKQYIKNNIFEWREDSLCPMINKEQKGEWKSNKEYL